jgi:integrase/recombinase XerD
MTAAAMLSTPHRPGTLRTIGLLAATGMRVGEAIRLDRSDVDFAGRMLVTRAGKLGGRGS